MDKIKARSQKIKKPEKKNAPDKTERQRGFAKLMGYVVVIVLVVIIAVMVLSQFFDTPLLRAPRQAVAKVITPIQNTFASGTDFIVDYLRTLKLRSNFEHEYNLMRQQLDELKDQAMLASAYQQQLQAYADMDDELGRNINLNGIKANVIGRDTSNYTYTLTLDVGSKHGVTDNMAVVVPGSLVGITYDTMPDSTKVKGIIDTECAVAALIESNRDPGTVSGTLAIDGTKNCRMYYLTFSTLPRPGDMVVTSGTGVRLPKGVPIGRVRESTRGMEDSKQFIVIEPLTDFDHIEYVIVYRYQSTAEQERQVRLPDATFVPLPSIRPVPTLIGQPEPVGTPSPYPDEQGLLETSPGQGKTPGPLVVGTPAVIQDARGESGTVLPGNTDGAEYNRPIIVDTTPTAEPSPAPATATPDPTFAPQDMTVEEDRP